MRFLLLIALLFPMTLHAQWDVLLSNTMPNTAKMHAHGTVLFHYGDTTTRSEDAGKNWSTVTGLTDRVTSMVSIDADVYAMRMQSTNSATEEAAAPRFDIVDQQQGVIRVNKTRNFNAQNALTTAGQAPSCSGVFASSTGRYEDFIKVGADTFSFRFDLPNAAALELKLVTMVKRYEAGS